MTSRAKVGEEAPTTLKAVGVVGEGDRTAEGGAEREEAMVEVSRLV
jgi:hypothetical protein